MGEDDRLAYIWDAAVGVIEQEYLALTLSYLFDTLVVEIVPNVVEPNELFWEICALLPLICSINGESKSSA